MVPYIILVFCVGKKINKYIIVDPVKYYSNDFSVTRYA